MPLILAEHHKPELYRMDNKRKRMTNRADAPIVSHHVRFDSVPSVRRKTTLARVCPRLAPVENCAYRPN